MKVTSNPYVVRSNHSMCFKVLECLKKEFPNLVFKLRIYRSEWANAHEFRPDDFFDTSSFTFEEKPLSPIKQRYKITTFCSIKCNYVALSPYKSEGEAVIEFIENQLSDAAGYSIYAVTTRERNSIIADVQVDYAL